MVGGEEHADFETIGQEVENITAGRISPGDKETRWCNDKVQEVIRQGRRGNHKEGRKVELDTGRNTRQQRKQ